MTVPIIIDERWPGALYFMHYSFARIQKTLRVRSAMEAGVADHVWSLEEIAGLVD